MELPTELEKKLSEFLQTMSPLRDVMTRIVDWQHAHDAEHRSLKTEVQRSIDSQNYRLQSLEATAGRGWMGFLRTALLIMLAAGSGYAVRAAVAPATPTPAVADHP